MTRFASLVCLLAVAPVWAQTAKPKVVFVCEHGSAKSVIAAAEFSRMAKEKGLELTILSRGTTPDPEIPKLIHDGLKADGLDVGAMKPSQISANDLKGAVKIVSFGPDLAPLLPKDAKVADWSATPSPSADYNAARDYIRKQLQTLLKDFEK